MLGKTLGDDDLVFSRIDGTPVDHGMLTHHFTKMVKAAGLTRTRFHDLRHSFASLMLLAGVHPKVVS
jgi:integrase